MIAGVLSALLVQLPDHDAFRDERALEQGVLDLLGIDVLQPAGNEQVPVGVEHLTSFLGHVEAAQHHAGRPHDDFAVLVGIVGAQAEGVHAVDDLLRDRPAAFVTFSRYSADVKMIFASLA
jgi:hypothetical protein